MQPIRSQFVAWGNHALFGLLCLLIASLAIAQTPEPSPPGPPPVANRPHLDPFPTEQDWSFLADPKARTDTLDRYKYVPWRVDAQHYASFGLECRTEYEYFDNWMVLLGKTEFMRGASQPKPDISRQRRSHPLGPQNLTDLHPVLQFRAKQNMIGEISWNWYWRESSHDGVYAIGSAALVDPSNGSRARYLGDQGDMEIRWAPAKHIVTA
jgi:hypothetical protein